MPCIKVTGHLQRRDTPVEVMSSAAAAAPGLSGPAHPVASWDEWQQRVDRTMEALVGFLSLFLSRQVSCPLKTVE